MSPLELALVGAGAFATAILSAVAGLGGGMVLLVLLLQFMPPLVAVPVHGAIQLVSNATRAWALRTFIAWDVVLRHAILLIPGGLVGLQVAGRLPRDVARACIGAFALVATWRPKLLVPNVSGEFPRRGFVWLGAVHGAINMPLGATGPMIAPFFKSALEDRREVVSTFATSQAIGHVIKIALFGASGFVFRDHLDVVLVGAAGVWLGSWVGTRLLGKLSEAQFGRVFKVAVTAAAVPLVLSVVV